MRILILSKRQYTNKDLLDDKYGRIFELAKAMAEKNIEVSGLCLSYRKRPTGKYIFSAKKNRVTWESVNLFKFFLPNLKQHLDLADKIIRNSKPDLIFASSDAMHIILASKLGRKYGIGVIADLYDNYESFAATKIPGIQPLFRSSLHKVALITCASEAIADLYRPRHNAVLVIENAVDTNIFRNLDRLDCRRSLGLPVDASIIGTAGSLFKNRGIDLLFGAFDKLVVEYPDLYLLLAGKIGPRVRIPKHENIKYLGEISYEQVPSVINAMNVSVVCNEDSEFGKFCFPQKMYEILSCKTPIVAARTPAVEPILSKYPENLYLPGNLNSLTSAIQRQLTQPNIPDIEAKCWSQQASKLINHAVVAHY